MAYCIVLCWHSEWSTGVWQHNMWAMVSKTSVALSVRYGCWEHQTLYPLCLMFAWIEIEAFHLPEVVTAYLCRSSCVFNRCRLGVLLDLLSSVGCTFGSINAIHSWWWTSYLLYRLIPPDQKTHTSRTNLLTCIWIHQGFQDVFKLS
jgi:hypothetical protein